MLKHRSSPPFGPQVSPFSLAAHPFSWAECAKAYIPTGSDTARKWHRNSAQALTQAYIRATITIRRSHNPDTRNTRSAFRTDKPPSPSVLGNETAGCFTKCASRCHNAFNVDGYTAYQRTERFPSFLRRSAFSLKAVNRRQRTGAVYPLLNGPGRFPFLPGPLLFSSLPAPRPQAPQAT